MSRRLVLGCVLAAMAGSAAAEPLAITNPDWLKKPSADDLNAAFPAQAMARGISGKAIISCRVTTRGLLADCTVQSETPSGLGFGNAALLLSTSFLMKPATRDGTPIESTIRMPIAFESPTRQLYASNWTDEEAGTLYVLPWVPWAKTPSYDELRRAYPKQALSSGGGAGQVVLRCGLSHDQHLKGCETVSEIPKGEGFAKAALALSKSFQANVHWSHGPSLSRVEVNLPIHFPAPDEAAGPRYLTEVDWTRELDPAKAQAVYPDPAVKAGVKSGSATVECAVADTGTLADCQPIRQAPDGVGFGAAAVTVASSMAVNLWTRDGGPAAGARIRIPLKLLYSAGPVATADAGAAAHPSTPAAQR